MQTLKKLTCVTLCLFIASTLASCYDAKEIEEVGYVLAIGMDKGDNGAARYTFQFVKPLAMESSSGGGGGDGEGSDVTENVSVEASSFYLALNQAEDQMDEQVDLTHCQLFIFSKELASGGLADEIEMMNGNPDFKPRLQLAVADATAEEYLKNMDSVLFANPAKNYQVSIAGTSLFPYTAFADLLSMSAGSASTGRDVVLPLYVVAGEDAANPPDAGGPLRVSDTVGGVGPGGVTSSVKIQSGGGAVFRDQAMVGEFDRDEVFIYRLLSGQIQNVYMALDADDGGMSTAFAVKLAKPCEADINVTGGAPEIAYRVWLDCDVLSGKADDFDAVQQSISDAVRDEVQAFLEHTANLNADVMGFGAKYKMSFLTWDDWLAADWRDKYQNARFSVSVDARVGRSGEYLR